MPAFLSNSQSIFRLVHGLCGIGQIFLSLLGGRFRGFGIRLGLFGRGLRFVRCLLCFLSVLLSFVRFFLRFLRRGQFLLLLGQGCLGSGDGVLISASLCRSQILLCFGYRLCSCGSCPCGVFGVSCGSGQVSRSLLGSSRSSGGNICGCRCRVGRAVRHFLHGSGFFPGTAGVGNRLIHGLAGGNDSFIRCLLFIARVTVVLLGVQHILGDLQGLSLVIAVFLRIVPGFSRVSDLLPVRISGSLRLLVSSFGSVQRILRTGYSRLGCFFFFLGRFRILHDCGCRSLGFRQGVLRLLDFRLIQELVGGGVAAGGVVCAVVLHSSIQRLRGFFLRRLGLFDGFRCCRDGQRFIRFLQVLHGLLQPNRRIRGNLVGSLLGFFGIPGRFISRLLCFLRGGLGQFGPALRLEELLSSGVVGCCQIVIGFLSALLRRLGVCQCRDGVCFLLLCFGQRGIGGSLLGFSLRHQVLGVQQVQLMLALHQGTFGFRQCFLGIPHPVDGLAQASVAGVIDISCHRQVQVAVGHDFIHDNAAIGVIHMDVPAGHGHGTADELVRVDLEGFVRRADVAAVHQFHAAVGQGGTGQCLFAVTDDGDIAPAGFGVRGDVHMVGIGIQVQVQIAFGNQADVAVCVDGHLAAHRRIRGSGQHAVEGVQHRVTAGTDFSDLDAAGIGGQRRAAAIRTATGLDVLRGDFTGSGIQHHIVAGLEVIRPDIAGLFRQEYAAGRGSGVQGRGFRFIIFTQRILTHRDDRRTRSVAECQGRFGLIAFRLAILEAGCAQRATRVVPADVTLHAEYFAGRLVHQHISAEGSGAAGAVIADHIGVIGRLVAVGRLFHQEAVHLGADGVTGIQGNGPAVDVLLHVPFLILAGAFILLILVVSCQDGAGVVCYAHVAVLADDIADGNVAVVQGHGGQRCDFVGNRHRLVHNHVHMAFVVNVDLSAFVRLSDHHVQVTGVDIQVGIAQLPAHQARRHAAFAHVGDQLFSGSDFGFSCFDGCLRFFSSVLGILQRGSSRFRFFIRFIQGAIRFVPRGLGFRLRSGSGSKRHIRRHLVGFGFLQLCPGIRQRLFGSGALSRRDAFGALSGNRSSGCGNFRLSESDGIRGGVHSRLSRDKLPGRVRQHGFGSLFSLLGLLLFRFGFVRRDLRLLLQHQLQLIGFCCIAVCFVPRVFSIPLFGIADLVGQFLQFLGHLNGLLQGDFGIGIPFPARFQRGQGFLDLFESGAVILQLADFLVVFCSGGGFRLRQGILGSCQPLGLGPFLPALGAFAVRTSVVCLGGISTLDDFVQGQNLRLDFSGGFPVQRDRFLCLANYGLLRFDLRVIRGNLGFLGRNILFQGLALYSQGIQLRNPIGQSIDRVQGALGLGQRALGVYQRFLCRIQRSLLLGAGFFVSGLRQYIQLGLQPVHRQLCGFRSGLGRRQILLQGFVVCAGRIGFHGVANLGPQGILSSGQLALGSYLGLFSCCLCSLGIFQRTLSGGQFSLSSLQCILPVGAGRLVGILRQLVQRGLCGIHCALLGCNSAFCIFHRLLFDRYIRLRGCRGACSIGNILLQRVISIVVHVRRQDALGFHVIFQFGFLLRNVRIQFFRFRLHVFQHGLVVGPLFIQGIDIRLGSRHGFAVLLDGAVGIVQSLPGRLQLIIQTVVVLGAGRFRSIRKIGRVAGHQVQNQRVRVHCGLAFPFPVGRDNCLIKLAFREKLVQHRFLAGPGLQPMLLQFFLRGSLVQESIRQDLLQGMHDRLPRRNSGFITGGFVRFGGRSVVVRAVFVRQHRLRGCHKALAKDSGDAFFRNRFADNGLCGFLAFLNRFRGFFHFNRHHVANKAFQYARHLHPVNKNIRPGRRGAFFPFAVDRFTAFH